MKTKSTESTVTDHEGNRYRTILIGEQTWIAQNLRVANIRNGDPIPTTPSPTEDLRPQNHDSLLNRRDFSAVSPDSSEQDTERLEPRYQWSYEGSPQNMDTFGRLYTWHAANDPRGVCPEGWRIPSQTDWKTLFGFLGGNKEAGGKLKAKGTELWLSPNAAASDAFGFSALPSGMRDKNGQFTALGKLSAWWASNPGVYFHIEHDDPYAYRNYYYRSRFYGLSIRCIKIT